MDALNFAADMWASCLLDAENHAILVSFGPPINAEGKENANHRIP